MINQNNNLYAKIDNERYVNVSLDEKGLVRPFFLLQTKTARRYAGLIMINRDIESIIEAGDAIITVNDSVIIMQSLFFFMIITYCKCFSSNDGRGTKLDFQDIFKNANQKLKDTHTNIVNLRMGHVAHAGSEFDKSMVIGTIHMDDKMIFEIDINSQLTWVVNTPPLLNDFRLLFVFVKERVKEKTDNILNKIKQEVQASDFAELVKNAYKTNTSDLYRMTKVESHSTDTVHNIEFVKI